MESSKFVLLPTDFSHAAENALEFAVQYARTEHCSIVIFHVSSLHLGGLREQDEILSAIELEQIEEEQLAAWKIKAERMFPDVHFETRSSIGFPVELIRENANFGDVKMVVMGTKGAHGIGDTLFGSNTANLINRCACPVMAIPEKARYTGFNSIVFATHFEQEDVEAVKQLLILFQNSKPTLTLLHVEELDSVDAEAAMDAWFHSLSNVLPASVPLNKVVLNNSDVIDGLHDYLTQNKSNLIVTSTRKRNVFERIFDRSVTRQLAEHEQTPLLALHVAHHTKSQVVF